MAEYRNGGDSEVIEWLQKAEEKAKAMNEPGKSSWIALASVYQAMAFHRKGDNDGAQQLLKEAASLIGKVKQLESKPSWHALVFAELALEEAQKKLLKPE